MTLEVSALDPHPTYHGRAGTSGYGTGIGGGNTKSPVLQPEIYDIPSNTWSGPLASAAHPRLYHSTALLLPSGEVGFPGAL